MGSIGDICAPRPDDDHGKTGPLGGLRTDNADRLRRHKEGAGYDPPNLAGVLAAGKPITPVRDTPA